MKTRKMFYSRVFFRFSVILLLPVLAASLLYFSYLQSENRRTALSSCHQMANQIELGIIRYMDSTTAFMQDLSSSTNLSLFLERSYRQGKDYEYYRDSIHAFVRGSAGLEYRSNFRIYAANDSIPMGYGIFYHLSDVSGHSKIADFIHSDENIWFLSAVEMTGLAEFPALSGIRGDDILCFYKLVSLSGKLNAVVSVTVPEAYFFSATAGYSINVDGHRRILNTDPSIGNEIDNLRFTNESSGSAGGIYWYRDQIDGFPLEIVVTNKSLAMDRLVVFLSWFGVVYVLLASAAFVFELRQWTREINLCIAEMKECVGDSFKTRLKITGRYEISVIKQNINVMLDRIQALLTQTIRQETAAKQAEIRVLQHQIDQHFIFNTMEIFSTQMELHGHYGESEAMSDFAAMFRYNMRTNTAYVTVQEEIAQVVRYINIQRIKWPDIHLIIEVPGSIRRMKIIRFIFQPFVENCVLHGFKREKKSMNILISAVEAGDRVLFTIYDDGVGLSAESLERLNRMIQDEAPNDGEDESIGIANINKRLKLFYGEQHQVGVQSEENKWVRISFSIPADHGEEN